MKNYEYSYEHDIKYCYDSWNVLRNKLNILDADALRIAEREITAVRMAELKEKPIEATFDLAHLKRIHYALFRDLYDWAGEIRSVNIAKGNEFCNWNVLEAYASNLFGKLNAERLNEIQNDNVLMERIAFYFSEINVMHPFREGNGRTQRIFIEQLAQELGYHIDFSDVSEEEMIEASANAFACEYEMINDLFRRIMKPETED